MEKDQSTSTHNETTSQVDSIIQNTSVLSESSLTSVHVISESTPPCEAVDDGPVLCPPVPSDKVKSLIKELFPDTLKIHQFNICSESGCSSISREDKFMSKQQSSEQFDHKWIMDKQLSYCHSTGIWDIVYVEGQGIFCLLCKKFQVKNQQNKTAIFADEPSCRFRKSTIKDHKKSTKHTGAQNAELYNRTSVFQKNLDHISAVNSDILNQAFYSFYYLARELIANKKIISFLQFLEHIGLKDLKYFKHRSSESYREIFLTIGQEVEKQILNKLSKVSSYGLMVDDMSDISVKEQMICYIQFVDPDTHLVRTDFLFIKDILENSDSADSKALSNALFNFLDENILNIKNVCGLATDGASVMVGRKGGLATLLKKQNPSLISVHCVCHRLALACTDTNTELKIIGDMELTLLQLWKLFHYSPKKLACFIKSLAEYRKMIIAPKSRKKVGKLLKRACKTRWLSFESSIVAIFEDFIPVLQTLNKLESDATAFGLLKKMNKVLFLGLVYILYFVLPVLARVSRIFQRGFVSFALIGPTLESAKFELTSLVEENKPI